VEIARSLADELYRPAAEKVDRGVVPRSHLDAWSSAGLLGLAGPIAYGGGGAPASVVRDVMELLAGACGATWFVATQHAMPLGTVAASKNEQLKERLLRPMCTGELLSGVAVAQLRRPGPPAVRASRTEGGWCFDGHVGWMTSWGICDVVLLGGVSPEGDVVLAMVPARDSSGLTASQPMALAAMQATQTVTFDLDSFEVEGDRRGRGPGHAGSRLARRRRRQDGEPEPAHLRPPARDRAPAGRDRLEAGRRHRGRPRTAAGA
jgi:alkylation response protein AidB-like acyl-CoA dehydrogenase